MKNRFTTAKLVEILQLLEDDFPKFSFRFYNGKLLVKKKKKKYEWDLNTITYKEVKEFCDHN
jgi:hypothetical protein